MERIIEKGTIQTGTVYVKDAAIFYEPLHGKQIQIPINAIAVIGEYTSNDNLLNKGKWNAVFVKRNGKWESIPSFT